MGHLTIRDLEFVYNHAHSQVPDGLKSEENIAKTKCISSIKCPVNSEQHLALPLLFCLLRVTVMLVDILISLTNSTDDRTGGVTLYM